MTRLLTNTLDPVLDRTVVPGYPKIGYGLRRPADRPHGMEAL